MACQPNTDNNNGNATGNNSSVTSNSAGLVTGENGVQYQLHTKSSGPKAKTGDFLTMHMQYTTLNDSVIFTSFNKAKPLSFKFQETLFKGILNEGLAKMGAGDSATFLVDANDLYGDRLPNFLKKGDKIKYAIALQKIQSQEEYQNERNEKLNIQKESDSKAITAYVSKNGLTTKSTDSGLHYIVEKEGTGAAPNVNQVAKAKYKVSLLDGTEVESSKNEVKDLPLNRQIKGLREGIALLKKGGKGKLIIPSTLAYGDRKRGNIPPSAVLVYDIEITDVTEGDAPKKAPANTAKPR